MGHSVKELIRKCHSMNPFLRQLSPAGLGILPLHRREGRILLSTIPED